MKTIKELRQELEQRKGKQAQIQYDIQTAEKNLLATKRQVSQHERSLEIVKQVGLQTQKQLEFHFSEPTSLALAAVFDDPYELVINFQSKRGKTEAEMLFRRRNLTIPPIGFAGRGATNIASLSLRLAYLSMRQDIKTRSTLILDEPFPQLKGEVANRRALILLNEISKIKDREMQIITISDERISREEIIEYSDRVFLVSQRKGISKVDVLK